VSSAREFLLVVTKAVIPAAGAGRRLRPFTYAVPKEMLPVRWHPAIEWVVAEAVQSGCTEIAIITSPAKKIIKDYLTRHCPELAKKCQFSFFVQREPIGFGHALLVARDFCAGQPFAVLLPDEIIQSSELPLHQIWKAFEQFAGAAFPITKEPSMDAARYHPLRLRRIRRGVFELEQILPRNMSVRKRAAWYGVGRYLFAPSVLEHAATLAAKARNHELDDIVIFERMQELGESIHAVPLEGRRYDVSTSKGFIGAWKSVEGKTPNDYTYN